MSIRPSTLPRCRRQFLRHLADPTSALRSGAGDKNQPGLDTLERHVRAADMYWVSQDMAALAVSSGGQLAAARWATADRPAPCGLLWWDGGVGNARYQGVDLPVDGVTWGPGPEQTCQVTWLIDRRRLAETTERGGRRLLTESVPPLVPMWASGFPVTAEPVPMADLRGGAPQTLAGALAASWLLMQQPKLVDRQQHRADGPTRRVYAREGLPDPEVTTIDLRRLYVPQDQDPDSDGEGRHYRHRWVVSGHWRHYTNDRYSEETRAQAQWIPSYVKGPDGAPLLSTERVNVWRR